ncbi:MAG: SidJ-related pseudokinase [Thermodesulfobacteriota bacterium]
MPVWDLDTERIREETALLEKRGDFAAAYMAVANLQYIIRKRPETVTPTTIRALLCVLEGAEHAAQRQVFFLYRKAANALSAIMETAVCSERLNAARQALCQILATKKGHAYRAAAEALGSIPLDIRGPDFPKETPGSLMQLTWGELLDRAGFAAEGTPWWKGRNLVASSAGGPRLLVVKISRSPGMTDMLDAEGGWMAFLQARLYSPPGCHIPQPIALDGRYAFRMSRLPVPPPPELLTDQGHYGMAFITHPDYFHYPNEKNGDTFLSRELFLDTMGKSAWLLGHLAASGIIHTAPIPLFHNRVQRERRTDRGLYEWPRGGRLDQWLLSCRYPNIGKTGLRDFEHFISFSGSPRKLYEHIGTHVFSLLLVAGSYFRNLDPDRTGRDERGNPVDARDLFDPDMLAEAVRRIFKKYYHGFTGMEFRGDLPMDLGRFTSRLIEEMGVDRHMEEILRVAEQAAMSPAEFSDFMAARGFSPEEIARLEKGRRDIIILTGPHLGGFNQQISLPELNEFTAATAALCIADRFCRPQ